MDAVRVVTYNAHFGDMRLPIAVRNEKCARMLATQKLAPSTIFMVQEAGVYLHAMLKTIKTHTLYPRFWTRSCSPMALLTLVPKALEAAERERGRAVRVRIAPFETSPMCRQFHVVFVRDMALVHTHLESCVDGARAREEQLAEIERAVAREGAERYGVFGDLNLHTPRWASHIPHRIAVTEGRPRRDISISPHALRTFEVE